MAGDLIKKWQKKIEEKSDEIADVSRQMGKRHYSVGRFLELNDKKEALMAERLTISKRLKEFKGGMRSLLGCLEDGEIWNEEEEEGMEVFRVDGEFDWKRIHGLILRECRRLEAGLPIYAHRQEILTRIHGEQVKILFLIPFSVFVFNSVLSFVMYFVRWIWIIFLYIGVQCKTLVMRFKNVEVGLYS